MLLKAQLCYTGNRDIRAKKIRYAGCDRVRTQANLFNKNLLKRYCNRLNLLQTESVSGWTLLRGTPYERNSTRCTLWEELNEIHLVRESLRVAPLHRRSPQLYDYSRRLCFSPAGSFISRFEKIDSLIACLSNLFWALREASKTMCDMVNEFGLQPVGKSLGNNSTQKDTFTEVVSMNLVTKFWWLCGRD